LSKNFKATPAHLAPILVSLLFGVLCAVLIYMSPIEIYRIIPFSENFFGSLGNAVYFVVLVGVGASVLYLLLKKRNRRLIVLVTGFALTAAVFMLSVVYLSAIFSKFVVAYVEVLIFVLSLLITILTDFAVFTAPSKFSDLAVLCVGGALGTFLGVSIPTLSAVLILGFLAVYDAFAVYRGPVGKIARSGLEQLRGLSFSFREVQMGLGDLTFYSMLSGHMFLYFGLVSCLASLVGILFGCLLAFKMLEKKGMFPGLPFPIVFGLAAGFLASLVRF